MKLLANVLRLALKEKTSKISLTTDEDPSLILLKGIGKRSQGKLVREASTFREELLRRSSEYESLHSESSYCQFLDLLKEAVFLHIVCKEENGYDLLNSEDLKRFSSLLNDEEKELRTALSAVLFYINKSAEGIPNTLVFEFTTFDDKALQEVAIFLSFVLSMNYPENKRDLLLVHYLLVRKTAAKFNNVGTQGNLSDDLLYDLFKLAIVLHYCGYSLSLRIPKQEKIRYTQNLLQLPSVESSITKAYESVATVKLPRTPFRFPLWTLLGAIAILLVLHWFVEVRIPLNLSALGFQYTLPEAPFFLAVAFFLSVFALFRFYKLKENLVKRLRKE